MVGFAGSFNKNWFDKHSIAIYNSCISCHCLLSLADWACFFVWILPYTAVTDCTTNSCLNIENVAENHRVEYLGRNAGVLPVSGSNSSIKEGNSAAHPHRHENCIHVPAQLHVLPRLLPIVLVTFCPMHVVTAIDIFWKQNLWILIMI